MDRLDDDKQLLTLSDEALLASLAAITGYGHRLTARLVAHLVVVEDRRLELKAAYKSLFDFCVRKLGMSEGAAFRRITAARLVKRFPRSLPRIENGDVPLSTLVIVRDVLTEENLDTLLDAITRKPQREVHELVARLAPKPDVPDRVTRLRATPRAVAARSSAPAEGTPATDARPNVAGAKVGPSALPVCFDARPAAAATSAVDVVVHGPPLASAPVTPERARPPVPLSEGRYKVQFTASAALRDKLERVRELLLHKNPNASLADVVDEALDALIDRMAKQGRALERLSNHTSAQHGASSELRNAGHAKRSALPVRKDDPRTEHVRAEGGLTADKTRASRAVKGNDKAASSVANPSAPVKSDRVRRGVQREVFRRDEGRCTFVSGSGERCPARSFLELDHVVPRACGGGSTAENLRLRCRAHNRLAAEEVFGRKHVDTAINTRRREKTLRDNASEATRNAGVP